VPNWRTTAVRAAVTISVKKLPKFSLTQSLEDTLPTQWRRQPYKRDTRATLRRMPRIFKGESSCVSMTYLLIAEFLVLLVY
jgi:hypothetical protein